MSAASELNATPRASLGHANRHLAHDGLIPAVLYGPGRDSVPLSLERRDIEMLLAHHSAGSTLVNLSIEGEKKPVDAMIREVQHHPVKGTVTHVDFLAVSMNKPVHAVVTLRLVNDPAGVRAGGVLTIDHHEVNVEAKPNDLPEVIEIDVTALEVGDTLHIRDIAAPKGVTILDDPDGIVASVTPPTVAVEEEVSAEVREPELVGEKAEEE